MAGNALVGLRSVSGGAVGVEQVGQQWADDPPEGPTGPVPVEHGDLKLVGGEGPSLSPGWVGRERGDGHNEGVRERHTLAPASLEALLRGPAGTAHDDEPVLVGDRPVLGESIDLVAFGGQADLRNTQLDLVGLRLLGEHRPQGLGVGVGQASR